MIRRYICSINADTVRRICVVYALDNLDLSLIGTRLSIDADLASFRGEIKRERLGLLMRFVGRVEIKEKSTRFYAHRFVGPF